VLPANFGVSGEPGMPSITAAHPSKPNRPHIKEQEKQRMTSSLKAGGQPQYKPCCHSLLQHHQEQVIAPSKCYVCAPGRSRTFNQRIKSPLLYQLSHGGIFGLADSYYNLLYPNLKIKKKD
jgi:hypothetical protein